MYTEWDDVGDETERGYRPPSMRAPFWFRDGNKQPCQCGADVTYLDTHRGYSDSTYHRVRCTACAHVWCYYIEG